MSIFTPIFSHGDRVDVYDKRGTENGSVEFTGKIVGRIRMQPMHYDVELDSERKREVGIPEYRIRHKTQ